MVTNIVESRLRLRPANHAYIGMLTDILRLGLVHLRKTLQPQIQMTVWVVWVVLITTVETRIILRVVFGVILHFLLLHFPKLIGKHVIHYREDKNATKEKLDQAGIAVRYYKVELVHSMDNAKPMRSIQHQNDAWLTTFLTVVHLLEAQEQKYCRK